MSKPVVKLSLFLNVALVCAVGWVAWSRFVSGKPTPISPARTEINPSATQGDPGAAARVKVDIGKFGGFNWKQIQSDDYASYLANLRTIGCPEETVRDIGLGDIEQYFERQRSAAEGAGPDKFWMTRAQRAFDPVSQQTRKQVAQLTRDKIDMVQRQLNADYKLELRKYAGEPEPVEPRIAFLEPEIQTQLLALRQRFEDQAGDQLNELGTVLFPEDMERLSQLHAERRAAFTSLLGTEGVEKLDAAVSRSSALVRQRLLGVEITEKETRELIGARRAFDDEFAMLDALPYYALTTADKERRKKGEEAFETLLKEKLGELRYAGTVRAKDRYFQHLYELTARLKLPASAAAAAFNIRHDADRKHVELLGAKGMMDSVREAMFRGLQSETEQKLKAILGDKGVELYDSETGGWLVNLGKVQ